jgi:hypothetical protein
MDVASNRSIIRERKNFRGPRLLREGVGCRGRSRARARRILRPRPWVASGGSGGWVEDCWSVVQQSPSRRLPASSPSPLYHSPTALLNSANGSDVGIVVSQLIFHSEGLALPVRPGLAIPSMG